MNTIRQFLIDYTARAEVDPTLKSLPAIRSAFDALLQPSNALREKVQNGQMPLGLFTYWVAIQIGKSKQRPDGRWTRYEQSFWGLIQEKYGHDQTAYQALVKLIDQYLALSACRKYRYRYPETETSHDITNVEAWEINGPPGYLLTLSWRSGRQKFRGFYSNMNKMLSATETRLKIAPNQWELG